MALPIPKKESENKKHGMIVGVFSALVVISAIVVPFASRAPERTASSPTFIGKPVDFAALEKGAALEFQALGAPSQTMPKSSLYQALENEEVAFEENSSALASSGLGGASTIGSASQSNSGSGGSGYTTSGGSGGSASPAPAPKLNVSSKSPFGSSDGKSNTQGVVATEFLGGGSSAKADLKPADIGSTTPTGKISKALSVLKVAEELSKKAANSPDMNASKSLASAAFGESGGFGGKRSDADLNTDAEKAAGLNTALNTKQDLAKVLKDELNKSEFKPPVPTIEPSEEDMLEKILNMIMSLAVNQLLGPIFGAVGNGMAGWINSDYAKKQNTQNNSSMSQEDFNKYMDAYNKKK